MSCWLILPLEGCYDLFHACPMIILKLGQRERDKKNESKACYVLFSTKRGTVIALLCLWKDVMFFPCLSPREVTKTKREKTMFLLYLLAEQQLTLFTLMYSLLSVLLLPVCSSSFWVEEKRSLSKNKEKKKKYSKPLLSHLNGHINKFL